MSQYPSFPDKTQVDPYNSDTGYINSADINALKHGFDGLPIFLTFNTYALMKAQLIIIGTSTVVYQIVVISDEKNNSKNLTNYTYINGVLNWGATTPVTI